MGKKEEEEKRRGGDKNGAMAMDGIIGMHSTHSATQPFSQNMGHETRLWLELGRTHTRVEWHLTEFSQQGGSSRRAFLRA